MVISITHAWDEADWSALESYAYGRQQYLLDHNAAPEINHLYFEDLRKIIWLYNNPMAGRIDPLDFPYVQHYGYSTPYTLKFAAGTRRVAKLDPEFGWIWWCNFEDIDEGEAMETIQPPDRLRTVNAQTGENEWHFRNARWALMANPNRYHGWDKNSQAYLFDSLSVDNVRYQSDTQVQYFMPIQTDPKEHEWPVKFDPYMHDKDYPRISPHWHDERIGYQIKEKIAFNKGYVTQVSSLGAVFTSWHFYWDYDADSVKSMDGYGIKQDGDFFCNQYCNLGGYLENHPGDSGIDGLSIGYDQVPQKGRSNYYYTYNPKSHYGYQNQIERVTSFAQWYVPVTDQWKANFAVHYADSIASTYGGDPTRHPEYKSHAECESHLFRL